MKYEDSGTGQEPFPASKRSGHHISPFNHFRELLFKLLCAATVIVLVGLAFSNLREKRNEQKWIRTNVPFCPIIVDSTLSIQHCYFTSEGLIIEALSQTVENVDEMHSIQCFFHINQYDFGKVRECYNLISRRKEALHIEIYNENHDSLGQFLFKEDADFEKLWDTCQQIHEQREVLRKEAEASDSMSRFRVIRELIDAKAY